VKARAQVLEWAEQGAIPAESVEAALTTAGVTPTPAEWQRFISTLFLWLGVLLFAAGVIFFFAYNWDALGRFAKFGLVEGALLAATVAAAYVGPDSAVGKASLFLCALLTGALLALIGQIYQTGADPYELFAWWAVLILPWTIASRTAVLWLLVVVLINLAVGAYFQAFRGFGPMFGGGGALWTLAILNAFLLGAWELAASTGVSWMEERWSARIVAAISGIAVTSLALWAVFESGDTGPLALPAYASWLAGIYFYYRHRTTDLFVLAGSVLSVIVVVTALVGRQLLRQIDNAGGLLITGLLVIAMSAIGAWWLKNIPAGEREAERR
jgi:uncharacterized membrane protein